MTPPETTADLQDAELRALVDSGDLEGATTRFMERYGGDILAFLVVQCRDRSDASEVFSQFAEDFWRGLERFQWRTTLRSWGYTLACNAARRFQRSQRQRAGRMLRPRHTPDCVQARRSSTAPYLRTEVKQRMRALRLRLPADDQILLLLRIDKGLSWNELAAVFSGQGDAMDDAETARWAACLRQRFTSLKRRLRALAHKEGLL